MSILLGDIKERSDWTVKEFKGKDIELDYTLGSLIKIDRFIHENTKKGELTKGGWFYKNHIEKIFSIASYVGYTLIQNEPSSKWITDEDDPEAKFNIKIYFESGIQCWPMRKVMKRIKYGLEDAVYIYGLSLPNIIEDPKDADDFLRLKNEINLKESKNTWWKLKNKTK